MIELLGVNWGSDTTRSFPSFEVLCTLASVIAPLMRDIVSFRDVIVGCDAAALVFGLRKTPAGLSIDPGSAMSVGPMMGSATENDGLCGRLCTVDPLDARARDELTGFAAPSKGSRLSVCNMEGCGSLPRTADDTV